MQKKINWVTRKKYSFYRFLLNSFSHIYTNSHNTHVKLGSGFYIFHLLLLLLLLLLILILHRSHFTLLQYSVLCVRAHRAVSTNQFNEPVWNKLWKRLCCTHKVTSIQEGKTFTFTLITHICMSLALLIQTINRKFSDYPVCFIFLITSIITNSLH